MNRKLSLIGIVLVLLVTINACKTTRSAYKKPLKEEGPSYLFRKLKKEQLKFEWLTAKFRLDLVVDKKLNQFKGQIRIKKDSMIWVSFSPALGIEAARLMITEDSVKFINRMNDTYFVGDYALVNQFLETSVDFDVLQAFIIGNDFQQYEIQNFRASIDAMEYKLSAAARRKVKKYVKAHEVPEIFIQNIWLNPENFKITRVNIKEVDNENRKLEANYGKFKEVEGQLFPYDLNYEISSSGAKVLVEVRFTRILLNEKARFPFNIPSKFTRII
ncbi:MAG: DUF4292 domain-containing protein [Bacteroidales bacterium]|nr:DUF4292 domain-containing protein [Bacteroidales bacterium]MCF8344543.1 DUF4292 domain-containing protein [Bacteroidales bacterium]MCF8350735.1 DUF4292 domain-containing protein [Bacteroidales bacterium]MCF8376322.1 DUF4292 domain-containing protein [Bacteroidales bacterium]MCF8401015.1 DUF4292 domain-containing protein [Bacteroidales bacterium]